MTIGEQIQNLRIQKGLTQERFAEMLEVSRQSVSKWELGQAVPELDKIIKMADIFEVSTDTLLLRDATDKAENDNPLHLACIYLVVKNFERSVDFYEKFFCLSVGDRCRSGNKFVSFDVGGQNISLMNEQNIHGHRTFTDSPYKFVQNYWVDDLEREHQRVKALKIGKVTEIFEVYPTYHYFHLFDPDCNIIEITGGYKADNKICQSCGMEMDNESDFGRNTEGQICRDYCKYCYSGGSFTSECTLSQMIDMCIPFEIECGDCKTEEEARNKLKAMLPLLKRWKVE